MGKNSEFLWFYLTLLCDWFRKLTPSSQASWCKTHTNHNLVTRVFPCFSWFASFHFDFSLAVQGIFLSSDWSLWILWSWFFGIQLKSALKCQVNLKVRGSILIGNETILCSTLVERQKTSLLYSHVIPENNAQRALSQHYGKNYFLHTTYNPSHLQVRYCLNHQSYLFSLFFSFVIKPTLCVLHFFSVKYQT